MIHVHGKNFFSLRDWGMVAAVTVLAIFGLTAVSGLYAGTGDTRPLKHIAAVVLGSACMLVIGRLRSHHLRATSLPVYALCVGFMALVLIAGTEVRGTKGWFFLGPVSLQPVEFMKLGLVLALASYLSRARAQAGPWEIIGKSALFTIPAVGLTLAQPDVGSAVVLTALWAFLLIPHIGWRERTALVVAAGCVGVVGWFFLAAPHHRERVQVLLDPMRDPFGAGYNIRQSIIAVGSGRIWGRGIGAGSQSQLQFLPEASTDFAFALIAEELGFAGVLALLTGFAILFGRIFFHLARAPDDFATLALFGIGTWWFLQATVYIGMNVGLAPIVGIPLPFVSYGGSAMLAAYCAAGCALAACGATTVPRETA